MLSSPSRQPRNYGSKALHILGLLALKILEGAAKGIAGMALLLWLVCLTPAGLLILTVPGYEWMPILAWSLVAALGITGFFCNQWSKVQP